MYNYTVMRQVPPRIVKSDYTEPPSTTTIVVYIYGRQDRNNKYPDNMCNSIVDPVDVKFLTVTPILYGVCTTTKREPLLPLPSPCATTRRPSRECLLPLHRTDSICPENARFEGITPRRRS